jgi:hypothetical protein
MEKLLLSQTLCLQAPKSLREKNASNLLKKRSSGGDVGEVDFRVLHVSLENWKRKSRKKVPKKVRRMIYVIVFLDLEAC